MCACMCVIAKTTNSSVLINDGVLEYAHVGAGTETEREKTEHAKHKKFVMNIS